MQRGRPHVVVTLLKLIWSPLRGALLALAAVVIFMEEFGWRPLARWVGLLAGWPPLARLESRLKRVSPKGAMGLFLAPVVLLFPLKMLALWLVHDGRVLLGVSLIVGAKLFGTALVARLFVLVEPQLMSFERFACAVQWWREVKYRVKAALVGMAAWRTLRASARWLRTTLRRLVR